MDRLLYERLNRSLHAAFSPHSYAYRHRGFGLDVCQRRIAQLVTQRRERMYFAKRDVADYFPSIDHHLLLQMLSEWIEPGDYLFELLRQRIQFSFVDDNQTQIASQGVPFGSATACLFANMYLTPLDHAMQQFPDVHYFRYADDFLLASTNRASLIAASREFSNVLSALKLTSKAAAHLDFGFLAGDRCDTVFQAATKFRHLGLEFRADGTVGLSRDKLRKIRNLFRFALRRARSKFRRRKDPLQRAELAVDVVRNVIESGVRSVAIIDYYLKHVDDEEQLRQLDRWLAEEILSWSFQNGHRRGNFRHLSFRKLREMGLPSLRHRRRLLRHGQLNSSFFQMRTEQILERERKRLPGRKAFSPDLEAAAMTSSWERAPPVDRRH